MRDNVFRLTSLFASGLFLILCLTLLVFPDLIFGLFGVERSSSAAMIGRRAACLFLGLTIIVFGFRNAPPSATRQTVALAIGAMMASLGILGTIEFLMGNVGPGIFLAVAGEFAVALAYGTVYVTGSKITS